MFSTDGPLGPSREILSAMADKLRHRGPDNEGFYEDLYAGFAFRRLSIIDLAGGNQPLINEDGSLVLVCNGEIYNFKELRSELVENGHAFYTQCDVEVLLHLYEQHGFAMLQRLRGQFAFAILDRTRRQLFLARDHAGVVPLYYANVKNTFIFASEIKAILEHPLVERKISLTGLDQILTFPGLVSPTTMFEGIHRVEPGHFLVANSCGVQDCEYWDLNYPLDGAGDRLPEEDYIEALRSQFCASIKRRLQADVPVGLYLSGGLDSSMIAAFTREAGAATGYDAFSVTFADERADENSYQQEVARHTNCNLHQTRFDWNHSADRMHQMIYHSECPVKETYNTCSFELSKLARGRGIRVILSGEGADELFAGYVGYRFDQARASRPSRLQHDDPAERALRAELWGDADLRYEYDYVAHGKIRKSLYAPDLQERLEDFDCLKQPIIKHERIRGRHRLNQRSYLDFKLRMGDHLLIDHGDCMALANSVEVRYPFLDLDLIELSKTIPPDLKLRNFQEKYILRKIAEPALPSMITRREKFGWFAPGSPEMLQQKVEWINDVLDEESIRRDGYFDADAVSALRKRYSEPGFKLNYPFENDWLIVIATFGVFKRIFDMSDL